MTDLPKDHLIKAGARLYITGGYTETQALGYCADQHLNPEGTAQVMLGHKLAGMVNARTVRDVTHAIEAAALWFRDLPMYEQSPFMGSLMGLTPEEKTATLVAKHMESK
jgi:hypothetical protein